MKPLLRICLFGPESTGKSTLARRLAEHYHTEYVPEVAREMITSNTFTEEDIVRIGRAQTERVLEKSKTARGVLFCDTDLITTAIYSDTYLQVIPAELGPLEKMVHYDQYFLMDIDVPWVSDGLRDLGEQRKREQMFEKFRQALIQRGIPFILLSGSYEEKKQKIIRIVDEMLNGSPMP